MEKIISGQRVKLGKRQHAAQYPLVRALASEIRLILSSLSHSVSHSAQSE